MSSPAYRQMAAELRAAIEDGTYPAGGTLPKIIDLAQQYRVAKQTAREAVAQLEAEGLVDVTRRRGTVVRARPVRRRLTRGRQVLRDERGYYFDASAQPWTALEPPAITWAPAPRDIAALLGLPEGEEQQDVLVRDRLMGDPTTRTPLQLATSYLPASSPAAPGSPRKTPAPEASTTSSNRWATHHCPGTKPSAPACPPPPKATASTSPKAFRSCASPAPPPAPTAPSSRSTTPACQPTSSISATPSPGTPAPNTHDSTGLQRPDAVLSQ